jgi:predicted O-methyltransferase YrrM
MGGDTILYSWLAKGFHQVYGERAARERGAPNPATMVRSYDRRVLSVLLHENGNMNKLSETILKEGAVRDEEGNPHRLHSQTSLQQCEFLQQLISDIDAKVCLEIGLAYGVSSLFICEAIAKKKNQRFISIDPFQAGLWKSIGLLNLKRAGYGDFVEFHSDLSHNVLPKLLSNGETIDFAYVDTTKVFDVVLLDAYYLTRLLRKGGVLVFDDCAWPGINKMVRYISQWPHLKVCALHGIHQISKKIKVLSTIANTIPKKERLFAHSLLVPNDSLGVNANCVAFQKIEDDVRNWDWHQEF